MFWLGCPHCYALEPLPEGVAQEQAGVRGVRARAGDLAADPPLVTRTFTTRSMHSAARTWSTRPSTRSRSSTMLLAGADEAETFKLQQQFASANGVSADEFAKAYNSFSVNCQPAARRGGHPGLPRRGRALHHRQRQVHHRGQQGGRRSQAHPADQRPGRRRARPLSAGARGAGGTRHRALRVRTPGRRVWSASPLAPRRGDSRGGGVARPARSDARRGEARSSRRSRHRCARRARKCARSRPPTASTRTAARST